MLATATLYEADQAAWDTIALSRPNIALMARRFYTTQTMERALGYGPSVIVKWVKKGGGVSMDADRRARAWLDQAKPNPTYTHVTTASQATPTATMLLVVAPDPAKVTKVLQLLGCDVTEI